MTHRHINIFFLFFLIFAFIIFGGVEDHLRTTIALGLAVLFSITAFILNWLTYDGAVSAGIFGTIALGLGTWPVALVALFFFVSGSLVSKDVAATENSFAIKFRRDGRQVWANGFWLCLWVLIWFISKVDVFLYAAIACLVAATADTWATELGSKSKSNTYLISNFQKVLPGTDGAISLRGSLAALIGATIISALFWIASGSSEILIIAMLAIVGTLGCFVDSYLGVKVQGKSVYIPWLSNNDNGTITVDNNIVNWMATGSASLLMLIITLIV